MRSSQFSWPALAIACSSTRTGSLNVLAIGNGSSPFTERETPLSRCLIATPTSPCAGVIAASMRPRKRSRFAADGDCRAGSVATNAITKTTTVETKRIGMVSPDSEARLRFPELDLVAFGIHHPSKLPVEVVDHLGLDGDAGRAQAREQPIEIVHPVVDHEGRCARREVLR